MGNISADGTVLWARQPLQRGRLRDQHHKRSPDHLSSNAPHASNTRALAPRTVPVDPGVLLTREQRDRAVRESMWKGAEATTKRLGLCVAGGHADAHT